MSPKMFTQWQDRAGTGTNQKIRENWLVKNFTLWQFAARLWRFVEFKPGFAPGPGHFSIHPMIKSKILLLTLIILGFAAIGMASEGAEPAEAEAHHGLTAYPLELGRIGPLVITNSMVATVTVTVLLIVLAQMATRQMKLVPEGVQNFAEWMVEGLYDFFESVVGSHMIQRTFWFLATIFIFILAANWFGLIPGVGTIGWETEVPVNGVTFHPWLRGGNADLNMTAAMAALFFFMWTVWTIQHNGVGGTVKHIFAMPRGIGGFMKMFLIIIFCFIGLIEIVSILFRPVALCFRLFGNIFAGENMLETMLSIHPWLGWIVPLPFYLLEVLVGLIQALVFALLSGAFTSLICEEHGHGESAH